MANNSIIQSNQGIVLEETQVTLSDEKLNGMLLRTYEKAVKDVSRWRFYKLYGTFLSIAGTLLVTLLTSSFNSVGQISAESIRIGAIIATVLFGLLGFVCLALSVNQKKRSDTEIRDASIKEIVNNYYKKE